MVGKGSAVLASHWSGPHGGGCTRSGAGGDPAWLGPFAQCIRAWRGESAEKKAQAIGSRSVPVRFHEGTTMSSMLHAAPGRARQCSLASITGSTRVNPIAVLQPCAGSVSVTIPSLGSAYRYLEGRFTIAVALSINPGFFLWHPSRRAKSMVLVSVGFSNPRGGVDEEAGRQQFPRSKATQDLGTTPSRAKEARRYG